MTCAFEHSTSAYGLGTLDADERPAVAAHLAGCASCRRLADEVTELAVLLARAAPPAPSAQDDDVVDRLLVRAGQEQRRRRTRRLLVVAAVVGVVAVGGGAASVALLDGSRARATTVQADQGGVHASVTVTPAEHGTELALHMSGVRGADTCRLVAVRDDGSRDVAATWQAAYTGDVTITGHTAVAASRLARLVVESTSGRTYVDLPVQR